VQEDNKKEKEKYKNKKKGVEYRDGNRDEGQDQE
jgi:hypothetical protein